MLTPDETIRKQRSISALSGNVKICSWLAALAAVLCIAETIRDLVVGEPYFAALGLSVVLVLVNLYKRRRCVQRLRTLQADLLSESSPHVRA